MNWHHIAIATPILALALVQAQPAAADSAISALDARPAEAAPGDIGDDAEFGALELAAIVFPEFAPVEEFSPFADGSGAAVPALAGESLAAIAGREDVNQVVNARNVATVASNSVGDNSRTGVVAISDNAFENLSGLSVININTGNNVAVNAAINVNISFSGAP